MTVDQFIQLMQTQWQQTSALEIVAVVFAVLQVLLAFRNSILNYPAGIISTIIFIWIFTQPQTGLYADASLNVYYLIMSIYGWIAWSKNKRNNQPLTVSRWNKKDKTISLAIVLSAFFILYFILKYLTPSNVPLWDSIVAATAWSGMWLLARRKAENWLLLNISNAIAIPLLLYKNMPLTAMLTLFLFIVAVSGYFRWKKLAAEEIV